MRLGVNFVSIAHGQDPVSRMIDFPDHQGFTRFLLIEERSLSQIPKIKDKTSAQDQNQVKKPIADLVTRHVKPPRISQKPSEYYQIRPRLEMLQGTCMKQYLPGSAR